MLDWSETYSPAPAAVIAMRPTVQLKLEAADPTGLGTIDPRLPRSTSRRGPPEREDGRLARGDVPLGKLSTPR